MKRNIHILMFVVSVFLMALGHKSVFAEVVVVHADKAWENSDIVLKGSHTLVWEIKEDDYWSFNTEIFPDGLSADGIPVPALDSYALPGENIGMLLGRIGDGRIITMGLSGYVLVKPGEGGDYLYLSMNDDLIGKYGDSFKDNKDEILVTITQVPMKIIKIDVLFITGCPGYASAKKYIEELVVEEAIDAEVNLILIKSDEDSRRLHFIGSPTVRVGGMDIESGFVASRDYGVMGRLYSIDRKPSDFPSKEMIRNAIRKEVLLKDKGY